MRKPRFKVPADWPLGIYHCTSRVVDRRFIFGEAEKKYFLALLRECTAFCGVQILTYVNMDNHFHLLVVVPQRPAQLPGPEQILAKLEQLTGHQDVGHVRQLFELYRRNHNDQAERELLEQYFARMWDLSMFMKLLKQRFTQWYNRCNGRTGTLWEQRFTSVVVEEDVKALSEVAAYIDLNPVRAGLVMDPKDYPWSGYGLALNGDKEARSGIQAIIKALQRGHQETVAKSLELYRMQLYRVGSEERVEVGEDGKPVKPAFKREEVLEVLKAKGKLPMAAYLRCRVRYFTAGVAFGSREFVEALFATHRDWFGPKRKTGARRVKGLAGAERYVLRDLRVNLFS